MLSYIIVYYFISLYIIISTYMYRGVCVCVEPLQVGSFVEPFLSNKLSNQDCQLSTAKIASPCWGDPQNAE